MTQTVTASTPAGSLIGRRDDDGGALYAGVPFAAPPVGTLRFRPPQPLPDGTQIEAVDYGPAPPQGGTALRIEAPPTRGDEPGANAMGAVLAASANGDGLATSEDCLTLNVWAPPGADRLPVVVWLYGGGFDVGSASPPFTDGHALSRLANVVVVAINYRVGALGFGYWGGLGGDAWAQSSNLGLQDQVAGLAWVRRNIGAVGGDPSNVTVAGESAGAFSIGALLGMPSAAGLFDKAILSSGSTRRIFPVDTADSIARDLAAAVGAGTMEELQDVEIATILGVQSRVVDGDIGARNLRGGRSWGVVLDGVIVPEDPHEAVRRGVARGIPLLVGATRDETKVFQRMLGDAFVPSGDDALRDEMARSSAPDPTALLTAYAARGARVGAAELADIRSAFLTDAVYRRPASELAAAQVAAGGRAWTYLFSATPQGPALGAFHGSDLGYAFDKLTGAGLGTPENLAVRDDLIGAWRAFAAEGDPGWESYHPGSEKNTRQFGDLPELVTEPPRDEVLAVWPLT
jgi:para-nitrobenzyl esterase